MPYVLLALGAYVLYAWSTQGVTPQPQSASPVVAVNPPLQITNAQPLPVVQQTYPLISDINGDGVVPTSIGVRRSVEPMMEIA